MQNRSIAVESPSASLPPPLQCASSALKRPQISSRVPIMVPMARLAIKSTGYSLLGRLCTTALAPSPTVASPKASNSAVLYFSLMPRLKKLPTKLPVKIVQVFTIVPNIKSSPKKLTDNFIIKLLRKKVKQAIKTPLLSIV